MDQRLHPERNHSRIGPVRILPATEHVEVTEAYGLQPVQGGEHIGIQLVDKLGDGIRRQGAADVVLHLGQFLAVSVRGGAGGIDKALHALVPRRDQHVQETVDVVRVGVDRIVDAAGHGAQRRLVKHDVAPLHRLTAGVQVADVTLDEAEVRSRLQRLDIMQEARGEVVQAGHVVTLPDKVLAQVAADESGAAGNENLHGLIL